MSKAIAIKRKSLGSALQVHFAEHETLYIERDSFKYLFRPEFEPVIFPVLPLKYLTMNEACKIGTMGQKILAIENLSLEVLDITNKNALLAEENSEIGFEMYQDSQYDYFHGE